jgi:hypothetical protein
MSTEGTSKRSTKRTRSPTTCERRNEIRRLRYQQNKDAINERRRALYRTRTTRNNIENGFLDSRKYRSLAAIMRTTIPVDVSFPQNFHTLDISYVPQSHNNVVFIAETSHVPKDDHVQNLDSNENPQSSTNGNPRLQHEVRLENLHGRVVEDIENIGPSEFVGDSNFLANLVDNLQPLPAGVGCVSPLPNFRENIHPPTESIRTISLGTTKVFDCHNSLSNFFNNIRYIHY